MPEALSHGKILEIILMTIDGKHNKTIASQLGIEMSSVVKYQHRYLKRMWVLRKDYDPKFKLR